MWICSFAERQGAALFDSVSQMMCSRFTDNHSVSAVLLHVHCKFSIPASLLNGHEAAFVAAAAVCGCRSKSLVHFVMKLGFSFRDEPEELTINGLGMVYVGEGCCTVTIRTVFSHAQQTCFHLKVRWPESGRQRGIDALRAHAPKRSP